MVPALSGQLTKALKGKKLFIDTFSDKYWTTELTPSESNFDLSKGYAADVYKYGLHDEYKDEQM